jgi:hypothetical protein
MKTHQITRRQMFLGASALAATSLLPKLAHAQVPFSFVQGEFQITS